MAQVEFQSLEMGRTGREFMEYERFVREVLWPKVYGIYGGDICNVFKIDPRLLGPPCTDLILRPKAELIKWQPR